MQQAAKAYGAVAHQIASPRELEASTLLKAASKLQAIRDDGNGTADEFRDALLYNRKLWSLFLASVTGTDNPLPAQIRQNVANLGLFVMNQTISLIAEPRREKLATLININREIAAGLLGRA